MSRSSRSPDRGTYPVVGLVAAVAVVGGVTLYAALLGTIGPPSDRAPRVADATLDRAHDAVTSGGVVSPARLAETTVSPDGYRVQVRLAAAGRVWRVGPTPADHAATASRSVGVRLDPGRVRPGTLTVAVWR